CFAQHSNLLKYKKTHSGDRPFRCGECGLAFVRSSSLVRHQHMHTGEWPYRCGECGK
ncbi:ZN629 protein, partial [Nyctibius bracteatus]|nr:ZN629 protein [Nyctibius bracteatus]